MMRNGAPPAENYVFERWERISSEQVLGKQEYMIRGNQQINDIFKRNTCPYLSGCLPVLPEKQFLIHYSLYFELLE